MVTNKIAKIRIPYEKLDAISDIWNKWMTDEDREKGTWSAHLYEDDKAFINSEKVLIIEGDSIVINPVITAIMGTLKL